MVLTPLQFFQRYYKKNITENELKYIKKIDLSNKSIKFLPKGVFKDCVNLRDLDLSCNYLTKLPPSLFKDCVNLVELDLSNNELIKLSSSLFKNCVNLYTLGLSENRLTTIDSNTFATNVNLQILLLECNRLTELSPSLFKNCINLDQLYLCHNRLTEFPLTIIQQCTNLHNLYLGENNLTVLPIELINLRNLEDFAYYGNPIENIHPILSRFLNNLDNRKLQQGIYGDTESVHNHAVQESVKNSIINILKDEMKDEMKLHSNSNSKELTESILSDDILTPLTKDFLLEYCKDTSQHSVLLITFKDLFKPVWNRIRKHPEKVQLKNILNDEMKDSVGKCFTGRLSRLVNVLNGYFDDVSVVIQSSDQISNVILAVKKRLEKDSVYTLEKHREIATLELKERGYEEDIIKVWVEEIV